MAPSILHTFFTRRDESIKTPTQRQPDFSFPISLVTRRFLSSNLIAKYVLVLERCLHSSDVTSRSRCGTIPPSIPE